MRIQGDFDGVLFHVRAPFFLGHVDMKISPEAFQERLEAILEHDGIPYGRAHLLFDKEQEHAQAVLQYKGYLALSDAFKCFFLEAIELLITECRPKIVSPLSEFYSLFLPRLTHGFQSLCGAERVAIRGYPYHAYTLLRNTFDNLALTSAALQRKLTFTVLKVSSLGRG